MSTCICCNRVSYDTGCFKHLSRTASPGFIKGFGFRTFQFVRSPGCHVNGQFYCTRSQ